MVRPKVKGISKIITEKTPQIKASASSGTNIIHTTPQPNDNFENLSFLIKILDNI